MSGATSETRRWVTDCLRPDERRRLAGRIASALLRSPFRRRRMWGKAVVVLRREGDRATGRGDLAHWLLSADLRSKAEEAIRRRVPDGCVLVWLEIEADDVDGRAGGLADFFVFPLEDVLLEE